jgi:hypothetical protein
MTQPPLLLFECADAVTSERVQALFGELETLDCEIDTAQHNIRLSPALGCVWLDAVAYEYIRARKDTIVRASELFLARYRSGHATGYFCANGKLYFVFDHVDPETFIR